MLPPVKAATAARKVKEDGAGEFPLDQARMNDRWASISDDETRKSPKSGGDR